MTKEITENRLGVNLARFRKLAGYTQTEIGELIGVSQSLLAHYEAGRRNIPVSLLVPISDVLKISIIDLFDQEQGSVKLTALTPLEKRIESPSFYNNAPEEIVVKEKERLTDQKNRILQLDEILKSIS